MAGTPSPFVALAKRLLEHEATARSAPAMAAATEGICRRLHLHLAPLIGPDGFRVLLANALDLTRSDHPFLQAVESRSDETGCLVGLPEAVRGRGGDEALAALGGLVARFFELLASFLGESLAVRLVRRAWPEIAWTSASTGKRGAAT